MSVYILDDKVLVDSGSIAIDSACCCTGACCVDGDCSIQTESDCTGMGGVFQGVGTSCDPNPCSACPTFPDITVVHVLFTGITTCGCTTDGVNSAIITPSGVNGSFDLAFNVTTLCWEYISISLPTDMASEDFWFNTTCSGPPDISITLAGANIVFCCNGDGTASLKGYFGSGISNPFFNYTLQPTVVFNGMTISNDLACTGAPPDFVDSGNAIISW